MFICIILLFFILPTLDAPTWCYVLSWIGFGWSILATVIQAIAKAIENNCQANKCSPLGPGPAAAKVSPLIIPYPATKCQLLFSTKNHSILCRKCVL